MILRRVYAFSFLLLALSCTSQSLPQTTVNQRETINPAIAADIRPGPNGPKLEFAELEGEFLIPAGISSFVLQAEKTFTVSAHAAESQDAVIDLAAVQKLSASVNGKTVPLEILGLEISEEGQILSYRLKEVPLSDSSALIEFKSPSGSFVVRGLVEKVDQKMGRIEERFDLDSTALAYIWESLGNDRPKNLGEKSLALLKQQKAVQQLKNRLYEHMIVPELRANQKPMPINDFLSPVILQTLEADPEVRNYLQRARRCDVLRRQDRDCLLPELKPLGRQPLPPNALRQASQRELARRRELKPKPRGD